MISIHRSECRVTSDAGKKLALLSLFSRKLFAQSRRNAYAPPAMAVVARAENFSARLSIAGHLDSAKRSHRVIMQSLSASMSATLQCRFVSAVHSREPACRGCLEKLVLVFRDPYIA